MTKELLIQARDWITSQGEIVFLHGGMPAVEKLNALHAALQQAIDAPGPDPEPVAEVMLSEGEKIIDASMAFFDKSPVGTKLYLHPPAVREPLTDAEIQEIATKAVRERKLSWLGFKKDHQGKYTIPSLSPYHYQFARAIESAVRAKPSTDEHEYLRIQQRNKEVVEAANGIGVKP